MGNNEYIQRIKSLKDGIVLYIRTNKDSGTKPSSLINLNNMLADFQNVVHYVSASKNCTASEILSKDIFGEDSNSVHSQKVLDFKEIEMVGRNSMKQINAVCERLSVPHMFDIKDNDDYLKEAIGFTRSLADVDKSILKEPVINVSVRNTVEKPVEPQARFDFD